MKIEINGIKICTYICDFVIDTGTGIRHVDVKGMRFGAPYQMFKLKKKLISAIYGIEIVET